MLGVPHLTSKLDAHNADKRKHHQFAKHGLPNFITHLSVIFVIV